MSQRSLRIIWWLGVPLVVAALTWGPYALLNFLHGSTWPLWRFLFVPTVMFDAPSYFEWIGVALSNLPAGGHIRTFVWILSALGKVLSPGWSVAEVWLLTLWVSVALSLWLLASVIAAWSGLPIARARLFAALAWISFVLPFMPRPGVLTWDLPFYLFGLLGVWRVQQALEESRYFKSALWTVVALAAAWTYPYFLIHLFLWFAVLWFVHLHGRFRYAIRILSLVKILAVIPVIIFLTPFLLRPEFRLLFEIQQRVGLAFSRLPVVSNSLLLVVAWLGLLCLLARSVVMSSETRDRLVGLSVGWITLLAAWLSNLFTGVYIHNDHFRVPALILSWISLAYVWSVIRSSEKIKKQEIAIGSIFVFATGMSVVYIFFKAYVFRGDHLNIIHASHWLTLAAASGLILAQGRVTQPLRKICAVSFVTLTIGLGFTARAQVFVKEAKAYSSHARYVPVVEWIRANVPREHGVCADPVTAEMAGSFAARFVYPTFATAILPKPDVEILKDLKTELAYYDALAAGMSETFLQTFDSMRGTTCEQFTFWKRVLLRLVSSGFDFDRLTGCPREVMTNNRLAISGFISNRERDDVAFGRLCYAVIIPDEQQKFWSLPLDYKETKIGAGFSAWRKMK